MNPYFQPDAPKPASIPLRPLGVGDIISGSIAVMRRQSLLIFPIAIVAGAIQTVAGLLAQASVLSNTRNEKSVEDVVKAYQASQSDIAITTLIGFVFTALLSAAMAVIAAEDVVGRTITGRQLWRRLRPRLGRIVLLSLIVSIVPVIGLIFLVAPGVWLWTIWTVAVPALVIERVPLRRAFGRSRELVKGHFWRVLGIRTLMVIGSSAAGGVLALPFTLVAIGVNHGQFTTGTDGSTFHLPVSFLIITAFGSWLGAVFVRPFQAIADTMLYVDLRMRKEGLANALQQAAAMSSRPAG